MRAGIRELWKFCGKGRRVSRHVYPRRPIEFRQVCAIARVVLLQTPTISDAEWKAAVLDTCAKQGWDNPEGDMLARALGAVERATMQTIGPRRCRDVVAPQAPPKPDRVWSMADLKALAATVRRIQARSAGAAPVNVLAIPLERWEISEPAALDEFYRQAEADRLSALRRFAEIAIARPEGWDVAAIRAAAAADPSVVSRAKTCFACRRDRPLVSHHVIQIQHGGSNYLRNRVDICDECHAAIHPWVTVQTRESSGWSRLGNAAEAVRAMVEAIRRKREADRVS